MAWHLQLLLLMASVIEADSIGSDVIPQGAKAAGLLASSKRAGSTQGHPAVRAVEATSIQATVRPHALQRVLSSPVLASHLLATPGHTLTCLLSRRHLLCWCGGPVCLGCSAEASA